MQLIGYYLQTQAANHTGKDRDSFARSAYNRYYYAVFLESRALLSSLDPKWTALPHKSYPEVLRGKVQTKLKYELRRAEKNGDSPLQIQLANAISAINTLAGIITKANGARIVADYEPHISVDFQNSSRFSLKNVEITEAHNWLATVRGLCNEIDRAWMQVN